MTKPCIFPPMCAGRSVLQCRGSGFGSGSGRIRIILPDPGRDRQPGYAVPDPTDPDRYQFLTNEKFEELNFFRKISIW